MNAETKQQIDSGEPPESSHWTGKRWPAAPRACR
jgi:hypothetical protein